MWTFAVYLTTAVLVSLQGPAWLALALLAPLTWVLGGILVSAGTLALFVISIVS